MPTAPNNNSYHIPLFLCIFILAFFPSLFYPLTQLPFTLIGLGYSLTPWSQTSTPPPSQAQQYSSNSKMSWTQKGFTLPAKSRGSYLITDTVLKELPEIKNYKVGLLHLFIQHTSCALSLNENWDEDVRYVFLCLLFTIGYWC